MQPRRAKWWHPAYSGLRSIYSEGRRTGQTAYTWNVPHVSESECPVSLITERSFDLVQIVDQLQGAKDSTGSTVGADRMPGFLLDAVRVFQSESMACETARNEALNL